MPLILDLEKHYTIAKQDPAYKAELDNLLTHYHLPVCLGDSLSLQEGNLGTDGVAGHVEPFRHGCDCEGLGKEQADNGAPRVPPSFFECKRFI